MILGHQNSSPFKISSLSSTLPKILPKIELEKIKFAILGIPGIP
jgi:hypothetical protein